MKRKVRLIIKMEVTEEYYKTDILELKTEILNGKHQKEMMDNRVSSKKGLLKYSAELEDIIVK